MNAIDPASIDPIIGISKVLCEPGDDDTDYRIDAVIVVDAIRANPAWWPVMLGTPDGPSLSEIEPRLVAALVVLGDTYGSVGVARVAAMMVRPRTPHVPADHG
jgi:hypothetical protein